MNFWKSCGFILCSIPLVIALIIYITNIGKTGFWMIGVILCLFIALILFVPSLIMVLIGIRREKKKKHTMVIREGEKITFDSFMEKPKKK